MVQKISSTQNPFIKELIQLQQKSRIRKKSGEFFIEGQREIQMAIEGHIEIKSILYSNALIGLEKIKKMIPIEGVSFIEISNNVYKKLAYRNSTEGILALAKTKTTELEDIKFSNKSPLLLVAEAPEKPGNIGALLRTADAAHADAVLIANPKTDLFNPNIIRSSVGCVFTNQIGTGSTEEIIDFLKKNNIDIYCAALTDASEHYYHQNYRGSTAIVVGTESSGLSETWLRNSTKNIKIPMQGKIDSMNVSVSAGILIFEAKRQRNFGYE